jgi:hypothetical protein
MGKECRRALLLLLLPPAQGLCFVVASARRRPPAPGMHPAAAAFVGLPLVHSYSQEVERGGAPIHPRRVARLWRDPLSLIDLPTSLLRSYCMEWVPDCTIVAFVINKE